MKNVIARIHSFHLICLFLVSQNRLYLCSVLSLLYSHVQFILFSVSNEIPDYPKRKIMKPLAQKKGKKPASDGTYCIICEFVMSKIDEELQNTTTEVRN